MHAAAVSSVPARSARKMNFLPPFGTDAFYGCKNLDNVTLPSSLTSIGPSAFYDCIHLSSITIPYGVTKIASYTFYGCIRLTTVTIPSSVTRIEQGAMCNGNFGDLIFEGRKAEWDSIHKDNGWYVLKNYGVQCYDGFYITSK